MFILFFQVKKLSLRDVKYLPKHRVSRLGLSHRCLSAFGVSFCFGEAQSPEAVVDLIQLCS